MGVTEQLGSRLIAPAGVEKATGLIEHLYARFRRSRSKMKCCKNLYFLFTLSFISISLASPVEHDAWNVSVMGSILKDSMDAQQVTLDKREFSI